MEQYLGKILVIIGIILAIVGILFYTGNMGIFHWIGNLPGDIRIERENINVYIPITTMLIFSLVLTLILWLFS